MIKSFINYIKFEKRYSNNTVISYENDISQFCNYIAAQYGTDQMSSVTHFMIRSWMVSMIQNGMTSKSVNRKLSSLRKYFLFLKRENIISINPTQKIIAPKIGKRLPSIIRKSEIELLLDERMGGSEFHEVRDKIIVNLLYNTGMREAELIGLKDQDVNYYNKTLIVTGKGNKQRLIPLTDDIQTEIQLYIESRNAFFQKKQFDWLILTGKGNKLYPKFVYNVVFKNLSMVSSSVKRSPHILRHSIATHLSDENVEINALKALLGHASLSSTQIYTHNSIEKLKKAYVKAHPKAN
ncbi:MAG: tyrosine-type recombinase/integrase [Saprospiraceae bacterium]|nr:tyrosine-type recombinase/integrase [Saprospiraceae bacterium]